MTDAIERSGLIPTTLDSLEATLETLITKPEVLAAKRAVAQSSVIELHDNERIAEQLKRLYAEPARMEGR